MMSEQERERRRNARIAEQARHEEYAVCRSEGLSMHQSARQAGYSMNKASQAARDIEPKVQKRIADLLEANGAGNDRIAKVVGDALVANKTGKHGTQPDHFIRLKGAEFAATVTGEFKRDTNINLGVQINLPADMAERFAAFNAVDATEDRTR